ncbi:6-phospho-beta-galactosidase [Labeo rohita]|uniref:6-phospho-beta-galactosidase n=1 Tax=Labeo rohita TaxID=84645 RepID=A0ABQ8LAA3_LABRO|nr:6-phospho-beta-galactosidase [Labeo rohita]
MCRNGTSWDDPLPKELQPRWEHWKADLVNLERINIPHCYVPVNFGKVIKRELHHFSDTSNSGYGQCSYLRFTNEEGNIHCALVIGKSRVAPIKVTTISRLELTAAVISVGMSNMLKQELDYADIEEHFWTDFQVVLGYINNEARRFHTFVANRVKKIHLSTTPQQWRYVPTNENPADHASRGLNAGEIIVSNWLTGPRFLWKKDIPPVADIDTALTNGDPEVRQAQTLNAETKEVSLSDCLSKLSSWSGAVQAVARLIRRAKGDKSYNQGGVLKVGGRLCDASLPSSVKHPVIIPKGHHLTKMIISQCHENVKHQEKGLTVNEIRSQGYRFQK